jgi:signal transduction histidine kinase
MSGTAAQHTATLADLSPEREIHQLREALAQAEAASRTKSLLIAKLGHELKTPLNAVVGLAQLIRLRCEHAPQAMAVDGWLEQIARLGWHMSDVVDTLTELGSSGAGRRSACHETFDVLEPMIQALHIVENDAARRGITIGFVGDVQAQVTGDRRGLRQVFVNLLSNAIKYNKEGGRVSLSVRGGECVRITVRDTGPGLTSEQRARLFREFERLGAEHSDVQGHGLGLVLCRELLAAMNGTIEVDSVEAKGCTFTVTLPTPSA